MKSLAEVNRAISKMEVDIKEGIFRTISSFVKLWSNSQAEIKCKYKKQLEKTEACRPGTMEFANLIRSCKNLGKTPFEILHKTLKDYQTGKVPVSTFFKKPQTVSLVQLLHLGILF